jgi:hypothetical protein
MRARAEAQTATETDDHPATRESAKSADDDAPNVESRIEEE